MFSSNRSSTDNNFLFAETPAEESIFRQLLAPVIPKLSKTPQFVTSKTMDLENLTLIYLDMRSTRSDNNPYTLYWS